RSANRLALVEIPLTFVLVGGGCTGIILLTGGDWRLGIIMACFAIATAPAATLAVVTEHNADGSVARHIKAHVARTDIAALMLFGLLSPFLLVGMDGDFLSDGLLPSLRWVLLPFPIGAAVGLVMAYLETVEEK